tara:strand:+ start:50 stop:448 length:399 start_codon:yes stop_codon:yes gene_type:complete
MSWKNNEKGLFEHLKDKYLADLEWSEGNYSHHDCYSKDYNCDIELKCRNRHYDDLVIEKLKYDKLILRAKEYNTLPVYICQTPKGIFAFNLSSLEEPLWETKGMPKTSHFNQRQFVDKVVGFFNISNSKSYD